ncbi:MAG: hypothetical protein JXA03_15480 [Bacteroidales bacterium]|nr:hypothetical protein [Bacteroidales bacterium]
MIKLSATGFVQVFFVAINTYLIAKEVYAGVLVAAFLISLVWSFNVKRIAFGSVSDRLAYAVGAAIGSVAGLFTITHILLTFNF